MNVLGIYRSQKIGQAWHQKVDFYEDGTERVVFNNVVLDQRFTNFLHETIMRFGDNGQERVSSDTLKTLDQTSTIVFKSISCEQAAKLIQYYDLNNLVNEFTKDRSDEFLSLMLHLITCRSRQCLSDKKLKK